ncbi:Flagellar basal-body rod modification protein FlgD [gamma proteobacterium HdN1]|nr:Flagellar basal-body rod modification protein FlgD [gamma proteobacterium HdN1]
MPPIKMRIDVMATTEALSGNSYLDSLRLDNKASPQKSAAATDKDMFMQLMLAQLKHQNPLDPQDGTEFVAQLAQFSSLEGITNLNDSVKDITSMYRSSQTLQATALVGREVLVDGDSVAFDGKNAALGVINAGQAASNAVMTIKDSKGAVVNSMTIGDITSSETAFGWDGTDMAGNTVAPGKYKVLIEGLVDNKRTALLTATTARVNSVSIVDKSGGMKLNLTNGLAIDNSEIKQIL